jgi:glycine cleavage system H lipoate-binding protein/ABC-type phosphate transport system substrate-binding protein
LNSINSQLKKRSKTCSLFDVIRKETDYNLKTMKRTMIFLISLLLMNYFNIYSKELTTETNLSHGDTIRVFSTPDLYNLAIKWSDEYNKLNPGIKIGVYVAGDTKMAEKWIQRGDIGFVSKEYYSRIINESSWRIVIGRDVIVPLINSKNPFLDEVNSHGVSPESFVRFFENPDSMKWGTLLGNKQNTPVNYYWMNDESIKSHLTDFLKTDRTRPAGIQVSSNEEMISAIQKDPYALGFCKITGSLDLKNQKIADNIKLLPIDRNGNGSIDYNEKIYDDLNLFSRGVWIGKYPKALFSNIYSVSSGQPKNVAEVAFLKWVITDGQQFLYNNGFSDLQISERQTTVDKLFDTKIYSGINKDRSSVRKIIIMVLAAFVITGIVADTAVRYLRRKKPSKKISSSFPRTVLNEDSILVPKGLYFDKTHTWAFMEQNGIVKVGINDFLQHITGPLTHIKMRNRGELVKKGEKILSIIQNGKQLNLYAPVSGIILDQNKRLETNSLIINSSPYNEGWVYLIEPTNWTRENQLLFMADKYREWLKSEFSRLKDFLAGVIRQDTEKYGQIILQDGGELTDGILSNLGPEVWEDFQTKFIDPSRQVWFYELF